MKTLSKALALRRQKHGAMSPAVRKQYDLARRAEGAKKQLARMEKREQDNIFWENRAEEIMHDWSFRAAKDLAYGSGRGERGDDAKIERLIREKAREQLAEEKRNAKREALLALAFPKPKRRRTPKGKAHARLAQKYRANGDARKAEQHETAAQIEG